MIKQVWVAVNPNDPQDIEFKATEPYDDICMFEEVVYAPWKPAMLIVEDVE